MTQGVPEVWIELRPSRIDLGGVGVFAVRSLPKGQRIADGVAAEDFLDVVPWSTFPFLGEDIQRKIMAFCVGAPEGFIPPPDFDFNKLSVEWYLNHSCNGNCGFDDNGDFVAIRSIQKGEEIAYDYALVESNPNFSMPCHCGAATCRHRVTGNDWKDEEFVAKNRDYMHPTLRRLLAVPTHS